MPIAPNLPALKRRLDRYFWANRSTEMAVLHHFLGDHFAAFDRVAVIGGLVRDFAREGRAGFRSDVDLVIEAPAYRVSELAMKIGAIPNRFGGYGFRGGPWRIDFWALETTWAIRHAGVAVNRLEDVTRCTFFDWDAVAYDLRARRIICSDDYLDRIRRSTLDINLMPTPAPVGNLLRSIRRLVLWHLRTGPSLRAFIDERLDEEMFRSVQVKERQIYSNPITTGWKDAYTARRVLLEENQNFAASVQFRLDVPTPAAHGLTPTLKSSRKSIFNKTEALRLPGL